MWSLRLTPCIHCKILISILFPYYSHIIPILFPYYSHIIPILFPYYSHIIPIVLEKLWEHLLENELINTKGVDAVTKVGGGTDCSVTQPFPAGGLGGGAVSPPAGSGAEPRKQTHFGKNRLQIT